MSNPKTRVVLPQTGNHSRSVASGACKPTAPYTSLQLGLGSPPVPKDDETPANHKNHPGSDKRWSNSTGEDSTVKFNPSCTAERPAVNNVRPGLSSVTPISQIRGESIGQGFLAQANSLETSSRVAAHEPQGVKQLPVEPLPSNGSHSTLSASNHDSNTQSAPAPEKTTGVVNATRETSTSKAEANRRARVAKFDSAAFDSQIYAQEVCLSAPEGVASYPPHDIRDRSDYGRVFLRTNPAIHGMHTRSEEWYRRKAAEIQARPRRKAWFGKVTQRQRWLRSREKKMSQVESTDGLAEASSFREEPQPRGHRHRPDLVGVPEAELPADVKESAAWAKACVRFRSDMETKRKMENTYLRKQLEQRTMHAQRYTATWECEDTAKQQRPRPGGRAECGEKLSLSKVVTREEILRMANQETERFFEELRNTSSPNPAGGRVALPG
ncbi:hypothetical protein ACRE_082140 [Hapsidospora chrysogenum ATCC 11550]|uniref:Uncharacterized protein n=1 Tax=Hapsidospora chrysogenum (strain ATCC 11550 / CBS 779.69 / DSM 880 / IAM 14645 / JCM 23072 / IMI 49137) TaxID=857340 RepID=A0A086SVF6_HAPC1|nr:hypothetical protein ACRE_082140 [Hapsidospora chrysogenum ATCC 11550]